MTMALTTDQIVGCMFMGFALVMLGTAIAVWMRK